VCPVVHGSEGLVVVQAAWLMSKAAHDSGACQETDLEWPRSTLEFPSCCSPCALVS
jgi:hypothetical protein